jgi:hypothetical protein
MQLYNKIMLYFWLVLGLVSLVVVSYMCFSDGINKWASYYVFSMVAFLMYFVKRWMMNRMEKHLAFLKEEQAKQDSLKQK